MNTRLFILCNYLRNTTEWNMDYTKLSPGCSISSVECLTSWFILRATIPAGSCDQAFLEDFLVFFHLLTKNFILLIEMMACTATLQTITYSYVSSKFKKKNSYLKLTFLPSGLGMSAISIFLPPDILASRPKERSSDSW